MSRFLPSTRRKKANRGFNLLGTRDALPSPTNSEKYSVAGDKQNILSKWQSLRNVKSADRLRARLAQLVDIEENRDVTLNLKGRDAFVVINAIDKVLNRIEGPGETKLRALKILRKLAGNTCQVPKGYFINRWTRYTVIDDIIARGGFADVRQGRYGKILVAVKTIRISQEDDVKKLHKAFCKESVLWMNVSHPNVLKLLAVEIRPRVHRFSMISEMMINGNITDYIRTKRTNRLELLRDAANGLQYLHNFGIVHGDLKGHNILINNATPPQACISDFGLCAIAPWMSFDPTTRRNTEGTYDYMAPELFQEGARSTTESDIYAFGIVVHEVVTGGRSFGGHRVLEIPSLVASGLRPERPEDPVLSGFGEGTWQHIEKCWDRDPDQRPTALETSNHLEHVAANSTPVDPGPIRSALAVVDNEALSRGDSSSRSFSKLLAQQSHSGSNRFQQTAFAAQAFINPGNVQPPNPIPAIARGKPNLLQRVHESLKSLRLLPPSTHDDA